MSIDEKAFHTAYDAYHFTYVNDLPVSEMKAARLRAFLSAYESAATPVTEQPVECTELPCCPFCGEAVYIQWIERQRHDGDGWGDHIGHAYINHVSKRSGRCSNAIHEFSFSATTKEAAIERVKNEWIASMSPKRESGDVMDNAEYHQKVIKMSEEALYIDGIPERGCGKRFGESVVDNILGYVKILEAAVTGNRDPDLSETLKAYLKRNQIEDRS